MKNLEISDEELIKIIKQWLWSESTSTIDKIFSEFILCLSNSHNKFFRSYEILEQSKQKTQEKANLEIN